jgi:hypothetical protein
MSAKKRTTHAVSPTLRDSERVSPKLCSHWVSLHVSAIGHKHLCELLRVIGPADTCKLGEWLGSTTPPEALAFADMMNRKVPLLDLQAWWQVRRVQTQDYTSCWFCKKRLPDQGSVVLYPMHKVTNVEAGLWKTKLYYRWITVQVPRCRACTIHLCLQYALLAILMIALFALCIVECVREGGKWYQQEVLFRLVGAPVIGLIATFMVAFTLERKWYRSFPPMREARRKGHRWGSEPPGS